jgi:hypothetical protein
MLTASELRELDLTEEASEAEAAGICFVGLPIPGQAPPTCTPSGPWWPSWSTNLRAAGTSSCTVGWASVGPRLSRPAAYCPRVCRQRKPGQRSALAEGLSVPDTPGQRRWLETAMAFG